MSSTQTGRASRAQMETFASALQAAQQHHTLPPEQFKALHAQFRAQDANGTMWTVGVHTRKWHRLTQSGWAPGTPPEELHLAAQVITALEKLLSSAPAKRPVTRSQMETFASVLQAAQQRNASPAAQLKTLHTQFRAEDANGRPWTVGVHTRKWHRLVQGAWESSSPPETLFVDEAVLTALQQLMTPGAGGQSATCGQCGTPGQPGRKFCSTCGASVGASASTSSSGVLCPNPACGRTVPAGKKFCAACGTRVP